MTKCMWWQFCNDNLIHISTEWYLENKNWFVDKVKFIAIKKWIISYIIVLYSDSSPVGEACRRKVVLTLHYSVSKGLILVDWWMISQKIKREERNVYFFPNIPPFFFPGVLTAAVVSLFFPSAPDQSNLVLANLCPKVFLFLAQSWLKSVPLLV